MKRLPTLHIINGDASLQAIEAAAFPGQVLVWREILSEGPAVFALPESEFWRMRQVYMTTTYPESEDGYKEKVLQELPKLEGANRFFEVVFWFDADLMCQVNLLYLLYRLYRQKPTNVSVCTPPVTEGIALMAPDKLQRVFENRQMLNQLHLKQAQELWQLYAGPDPTILQHYLQEKEILLPYLKQALHLHLQRFPHIKTGLGLDQQTLLEGIRTGADNAERVMEYFWKEQPLYGLGDWQLQHLLQQLSPELLTMSSDKISLTEEGLKVSEGEANFLEYKEPDFWHGGAHIKGKSHRWCRTSVPGEILSC